MVNVCEQFAHEYHISFNPSKSKLMSFNLSRPLGTPIFLNGQKVEVVDHDSHLGNYVATDLRDINITKHVCDLYQRSNNVVVVVDPLLPDYWGESASVVFWGFAASFSRQLSSRAAMTKGSLHKSRAESVVGICGQLKRCCVVCS